MKPGKKRWIWIALLILGLYLAWLAAGAARFRTYTQDSAIETPEEIQGIYHIHTEFSDGSKSATGTAELAARMDLDFIILTDHGRPNSASLAFEGWKDGVLVIPGSELSVNRGHLVGLGFDPPRTEFSQNAELAAHAIQASNGFTIIAHPYSKVNWSWGVYAGYSGIEIISADALLRKNIGRWGPSLPLLLIRPEIVLLKMLRRPERNLRKWDEMNREHRVFGYFSTDAHYLYGPLFSTLRIHALLDRPLSPDSGTARAQVLNALRTGRFYNAVEAAATARGFRFWGETGGQIHPMGSSAAALPLDLKIHLPAPYAVRLLLFRDGTPVLDTEDKTVVFQATLPGVYRVEAYLLERTPLAREMPWILSNPIFIREDQP